MVIKKQPHPAIYIGDFNSHHEQWRYKDCDLNGEKLVQWAENEHVHLVYDAKDRCTLRSAAWRQEYNPDLCFVSSDHSNKPLAISRKVLGEFPHSQHRPVLIEVGTQIPIINSIPKPRWNFNKANWFNYTDDLDKCLGLIPPISQNYYRFVGAAISSAKKHIPRGYRKDYIPGWSHNSDQLYQKYLETGDQDIADELLHSLDAARRQKWTETVESLNFQTSSRKAWSLLRKLGGGAQIKSQSTVIKPNNVATYIVETSRAPKDKDNTTWVKRELKKLKNKATESKHSRPFTEEEIAHSLLHTLFSKLS